MKPVRYLRRHTDEPSQREERKPTLARDGYEVLVTRDPFAAPYEGGEELTDTRYERSLHRYNDEEC